MKVTSLRSAPLILAGLLVALPISGQEWSPLNRGSDNIEVLGHLPLGPRLSVADMDLDEIAEVRNVWQFYRDRRPETYADMTALLP